MRHRSFITPLTLLVVLMIISCSLGTRLSTPTATSPPAAPLDSDGDLVLDADDNCPITPNPDQADADANGLGDPCDTPYLDGFAYTTPQGVVQSGFDERLRPAKIVAPEVMITFAWSEDAIHIDLIVETAGESRTVALEIDLSDAALLAALDAAEAERGQDLSALRAWIAENPGRLLAVARGEQPPPRPSPPPASSLPAGKSLLVIAKKPAALDQQTNLDLYMDFLAASSMFAYGSWRDFEIQHPALDPAIAAARNILLDQSIALNRLFLDQRDNCQVNCTFRCRINCGYGNKGACFTDFPRISPCYENLEPDCTSIGGVFHHGQNCPGACWVSAGGVSGCSEMDEKSCREWPSRANIIGHGNDLTILAFCPGQACDKPMCSQPVP